MNNENFESIITDAETIMKTNYPPTPFIVKDLITAQGLIIIAGPAKAGKSLFIIQLLDAISGHSSEFLACEVTAHGAVLYLALEDNDPRLKERFLKQKLNPTSNFKVAFKWTVDEKAISDLDKYLTEHPEIILVVIDTKAKICNEQGTQLSYQSEYNFMGAIKECADKHKICIMLVTHLRKRPSQEDVFNDHMRKERKLITTRICSNVLTAVNSQILIVFASLIV